MFFLLDIPPPRSSTLFPYTTLFRSNVEVLRYSKSQFGKVGKNNVSRQIADAVRTDPILEQGDQNKQIGVRNSQLDYLVCRLVLEKTRLNSSHSSISYAVFCLKKKIT